MPVSQFYVETTSCFHAILFTISRLNNISVFVFFIFVNIIKKLITLVEINMITTNPFIDLY